MLPEGKQVAINHNNYHDVVIDIAQHESQIIMFHETIPVPSRSSKCLSHEFISLPFAELVLHWPGPKQLEACHFLLLEKVNPLICQTCPLALYLLGCQIRCPNKI